MTAKKKRKREIGRRDIGFQILGGHISPIQAHLIYEIHWSDGSYTIERGNALHTMPGILPSGAKLPDDVRGDLAPHMRAIQELAGPIRAACWELDKPKKRKKKK